VLGLSKDVYVDPSFASLQKARHRPYPERTIVHEKEQKAYSQSCGENVPQAVAGRDAILNSPTAQWLATGVVVGTACYYFALAIGP